MLNCLPYVQDRLLKDPTLSKMLETNGFVLIDAELENETSEIQDYITHHFSFPKEGFYYSLLSNEFHENQFIQSKLSGILSGFYEKYFQKYRTITESFLAKPAHTSDELLLHQDWCYTDENTYNAYNIWLPLIDVNENNGSLFFLPGSHLWFHNFRSGTLPTGRISISEISVPIETVNMRRGQVLIFHPAVFHGSHPNRSDINRIVATSTILEKDAPFLFYAWASEKQIEQFQVPDDALLKDLKALAIGGKPMGTPSTFIDYVHHVVNANDLREKSSVF